MHTVVLLDGKPRRAVSKLAAWKGDFKAGGKPSATKPPGARHAFSRLTRGEDVPPAAKHVYSRDGGRVRGHVRASTLAPHPPARAAHPSHPSESGVRVCIRACIRVASESSGLAGPARSRVESGGAGRRFGRPSRESESFIRVAHPSHLSESRIRVGCLSQASQGDRAG
jgi:hypothetical protein